VQVFPVLKDYLTSLSHKETKTATRLDTETLFMVLGPAFQLFSFLPLPYLLVAARTRFALRQQCPTNIFPSKALIILIRTEVLISVC